MYNPEYGPRPNSNNIEVNVYLMLTVGLLAQFLYFMVSFSNPIVGNCLAYSSTSWRSFAISDSKLGVVARKSFNFVPELQKSIPHNPN